MCIHVAFPFIFNKENKTVHLSRAMFALELGGEELERLRGYNIVPALDPAFIKRGRAFFYTLNTVFGYRGASEIGVKSRCYSIKLLFYFQQENKTRTSRGCLFGLELRAAMS